MMWKIVFQIIPFFAWGFALAFGLRPLALRRRTFWILAALLAAAFGKFAFFAVAGGDGFVPDLPSAAIGAYGGVYGAAMLFAAFSSAAFLADVLFAICRHPVGVRAKRVRAAVFAVLAAALAGWGMYESVRMPDARRVEIAWDELPPAFDGYRIVHLSDIHCSTAARRPRIEQIVSRVNALDADIVAITGDFVDGLVADRRDDLEPLSRIAARDGVIGCTGNHEAYWDWNAWREEFRRWNVDMVDENGPRIVRRGEDALVLGGLMDPAFRRWRAVSCDARAAFSGTPEGAFRILLFHRPIPAEIGAAAADVRLLLSGHTHGGALPVLRWLVARVNEGHVRGLYTFAPGRYLYNSPGTGQWAGFPLRLLNPAEITEIVLRRK